ncbi:YceI family protein [Dokdonella soli]|uniref:YceI family protein n=2 Tax=Dokdonella soli TaxID=529810 RepID=A0ABN1IRT9_9GAMM
MALVTSAPGAATDTYLIDSMHSMPSFAYKHLDFSTFRGRFDKISGVITLDSVGHTGTADVTIEVRSVSTGVPMLDEFLRSPKFFDAAKFPSITFKSGTFMFNGDKLASVIGDLTVHGVTKSVALDVVFVACHQHQLLKVPACGADARTTIRRSDFGLAMFIPNDSDEVTLEIGVEALKKE